jgi:hypothetical protein
MDKEPQIVDVLMCVGPQDIDSIFTYSVRSCFKNFKNMGKLYIVSPKKELLKKKLENFDFFIRCEFLHDSEVLHGSLANEDGWYRQQIIKLSAHNICQTKFIGSLCSDTIILGQLSLSDCVDNNGLPIIFYRVHKNDNPHSIYEQNRIKHICHTLGINGKKALQYYDFIIDFKICEARILRDLNLYLDTKYGAEYFKAISPGKCPTLKEKVVMAEWSLYGAYVSDIYNEKRTFKGYDDSFITQIHSENDYHRFEYKSKIVHFVHKSLDFDDIKTKLDNTLK